MDNSLMQGMAVGAGMIVVLGACLAIVTMASIFLKALAAIYDYIYFNDAEIKAFMVAFWRCFVLHKHTPDFRHEESPIYRWHRINGHDKGKCGFCGKIIWELTSKPFPDPPGPLVKWLLEHQDQLLHSETRDW
jgi:hypothetical protein